MEAKFSRVPSLAWKCEYNILNCLINKWSLKILLLYLKGSKVMLTADKSIGGMQE